MTKMFTLTYWLGIVKISSFYWTVCRPYTSGLFGSEISKVIELVFYRSLIFLYFRTSDNEGTDIKPFECLFLVKKRVSDYYKFEKVSEELPIVIREWTVLFLFCLYSSLSFPHPCPYFPFPPHISFSIFSTSLFPPFLQRPTTLYYYSASLWPFSPHKHY